MKQKAYYTQQNTQREYESDKEDMISSYNEAKFQIYRLHTLWQLCNRLSNLGRLKEWKWKLDTIWRELTPDAIEKGGNWFDDGVENKFKKKIDELNENICKANDRTQKYNALQAKETYLRFLQDSVGKGSKRISEDEDSIDN